MTLSMSNREGIEIDYCPKCRGVWLDRGELDKIIERSMTQPERPPQPQQRSQTPPPADPRYSQDGYRKYDDDDDYHKHRYGKRRRGLLGELFDFD
jgi:Zn-finger nucleic acid-binding protein